MAKPPRSRPRARPQAADAADRVYGLHAALALFARRPGDVERAFVTEDALGPAGPILKALAAARRSYTVVSDADLDRITESTHHEGLCLMVKPRAPISLEAMLKAPGPALVAGLGGVGNPHNLGAILRSAAHFGARAVLVQGPGRVPPSAVRVAQGGAEAVPVVAVPRWQDALAAARRAGFAIVATSSHATRSIHSLQRPPRTLLLLGGEAEGLAPPLLGAADAVVTIPGTGAVESLNVAAAAAILLCMLAPRAP